MIKCFMFNFASFIPDTIHDWGADRVWAESPAQAWGCQAINPWSRWDEEYFMTPSCLVISISPALTPDDDHRCSARWGDNKIAPSQEHFSFSSFNQCHHGCFQRKFWCKTLYWHFIVDCSVDVDESNGYIKLHCWLLVAERDPNWKNNKFHVHQFLAQIEIWCSPKPNFTTWPSSDIPLTLTRPLPNLD